MPTDIEAPTKRFNHRKYPSWINISKANQIDSPSNPLSNHPQSIEVDDSTRYNNQFSSESKKKISLEKKNANPQYQLNNPSTILAQLIQQHPSSLIPYRHILTPRRKINRSHNPKWCSLRWPIRETCQRGNMDLQRE